MIRRVRNNSQPNVQAPARDLTACGAAMFLYRLRLGRNLTPKSVKGIRHSTQQRTQLLVTVITIALVSQRVVRLIRVSYGALPDHASNITATHASTASNITIPLGEAEEPALGSAAELSRWTTSTQRPKRKPTPTTPPRARAAARQPRHQAPQPHPSTATPIAPSLPDHANNSPQCIHPAAHSDSAKPRSSLCPSTAELQHTAPNAAPPKPPARSRTSARAQSDTLAP